MQKSIIFLLFILLIEKAHSANKDKIIENLVKTENMSFKFKQTINGKSEFGNCIIKYPKKILCEYNNANKKIMISNGKSLLIKNKNSQTFYLYPLKKTPLHMLLDKDFLIYKIKNLEERLLNNRYINFSVIENDNVINVFFDNKNFNLIGWQTEDLFQNLTVTFISSIVINQKINDDLFIFPSGN